MKKSEALKAIREVLYTFTENNTTGTGEGYNTPRAFGKGKATSITKKWGFKQVSRPKRPSHTKGFDYL